MANKPLAAIILAAGDGTRLRSQVPKSLHRICGRPMIVHILRTIEGLADAVQVVVVGFCHERMRETLAEYNVAFTLQDKRIGTGHAVLCTQPHFEAFEGDILVLVGDAPLMTRRTLEKLIERHRYQDAAATVLTTKMKHPDGYGRVLRHPDNRVLKIVEDKDANIYEKKVNEINTGTYVFDCPALFEALHRVTPNNEQGEYYLTDVIQILVNEKRRVEAYSTRDSSETMGINDRIQFAVAERIMRDRILKRLMLSGVTILDPASTFIDDSVGIGIDTIIHPTTHMQGKTLIGEGCEIGPLTQIEDCEIGAGCRINSSYLRGCTLPPGMSIGPFANLQNGEVVYANAYKSNRK